MHFWASEKEEKDKKEESEKDEGQANGYANGRANGQTNGYVDDQSMHQIKRRPLPSRPGDRHYQEHQHHQQHLSTADDDITPVPTPDHSSTGRLSVDMGETFEVKSE